MNRAIAPEESKGTIGWYILATVICWAFIVPFIYSLANWKSAWDSGALFFFGLASPFAIAMWILFTYEAARVTRAYRRFGHVPLQIEGPAPAAGGRLSASIVLPAEVDAPTILAELECSELILDTKGRATPRPFWAKRPRIALDAGATQLAFDIPAWLPHSVPVPKDRRTVDGTTRFWSWSLRVHADIEGVDFDYTYPIEVQPAAPGTDTTMPAALAPPASPAGWVGVGAAASPGTRADAPELVLSENPAPGAAAAPLKMPSTWVLVAANAVPVAGVALAGWSLQEMIFLYWVETVIVCAFSTVYVLLAYDFTSDVVEQNRKRALLDEELVPLAEANAPAKRVWATILSAIYFAILCTISGTILFKVLDIRMSPGQLFRELLGETGLMAAIFVFLAYHAYAFTFHFRDHMLARPSMRVFGQSVAMLLLAPFLKGSGFVAALILVPIVAAKIWFERRMLEFEHTEAAQRHTAHARAAALEPLIRQAPAAGNRRPLAHYLGAWRLAPGERQSPGWLSSAEFYQDAGRLRLRLADKAGPGDAPDALESVAVNGSKERIAFIEVRLKSGGTRRILRFTASATDPEGLDLSETQYPEGKPDEMQARTFALQRRK